MKFPKMSGLYSPFEEKFSIVATSGLQSVFTCASVYFPFSRPARTMSFYWMGSHNSCHISGRVFWLGEAFWRMSVFFIWVRLMKNNSSKQRCTGLWYNIILVLRFPHWPIVINEFQLYKKSHKFGLYSMSKNAKFAVGLKSFCASCKICC